MRIYLCASSDERPRTDPRLLAACVDYHFDALFPAGLPPFPDGVMLLGGDMRSDRTGEIGAECRRRGFAAVLAGFGAAPGVEVFRFCDGVLRQGLTPILTESAWRAGCGAELMISSAVTEGELRSRLAEARERCPELCLDLERLRHSFSFPSPDGEGRRLSGKELTALLSRRVDVRFSEELGCKAFTVEEREETLFVLFDDEETLARKIRLAAEMGVSRCFLLYPEWNADEASAALAE